MSIYLYKVKNDSGRFLHGIGDAKNIKELKKQIKLEDYFFVSAQKYSPAALDRVRLSVDELLMFTHRLSYLIESGLPIIQALNILWKQSEQKEVQIIVSHMRKKLEDGGTLQEAFSFFPNVFPPMYLALIEVAEIGAGLVEVLKKLTGYIQEQKEFNTRVQKATLYPSFVFCFAVLVVIGMFVFVVPTFQKVIIKLHGELPILTQILFGFSNLMRNPYFLGFLALLVVTGIVAWRYLIKIEKFEYWVDSWKLRAPFLRTVLYPLSIGRFTRCLGLLLGSGVSLLAALDVAKKTVVNKRIEAAIGDTKKQIIEGGTLYEAFKSVRIFPAMLVDIMGIGESSGRLQQLLDNAADHLEEEADYALNKFLTFLEPLLIIFVGAIVLVVLLGIYLPIFAIQGSLRSM